MTRRLFKVLAFLFILAALAAWYESASIRRERQRLPAPGRMVEIGGRRLHLICIGTGEPVVVFEPSSRGGATSSSRAREEISATTRVCSYDRMSAHWSDDGPDAMPTAMLVEDLERLLDRAEIRSPYILVASSIGGLTASQTKSFH